MLLHFEIDHFQHIVFEQHELLHERWTVVAAGSAAAAAAAGLGPRHDACFEKFSGDL